MKVMGFEHNVEKAVQFKPKPGGNVERVLISVKNSSDFYILYLLLALFSVCPRPTHSVLYLNCSGKSTVGSAPGLVPSFGIHNYLWLM